ncbi:ribokinase [Georgenia sp. SYP-B2076]|uniref:ribokinase n=1 Tax=Georgenia sp. SYP-B2076 TaxID=2495881 RepID=UPI000F8D0544|nr:ribokinase [Georgenia sp. SYP-B2076]
MSNARVVVVGSANVDVVLDIDHRPGPGETILGSDVVVTPGGKGANQAVAAARLGGQVAFVGCIGGDDRGRLLRASLAGTGMDLTGLRVVDASTGTAIIMVTPDGENSIIVSPGANRHVTPAQVDALRAVWAGAAVVVLQLEIPLETVTHVARRAHEGGARVVVNAAPAAALGADVLAVADPLVVNESEAAYLITQGGKGDGAPPVGAGTPIGAAPTAPAGVAGTLLALGPRSVVLTLGAEGAVLLGRDDAGRPAAPVHVPAHRVTAVDTTGAGDAFVGAVATRLAAGDSLEQAVREATAVSAVAVTRRGAQDSFPTLGELDTH